MTKDELALVQSAQRSLSDAQTALKALAVPSPLPPPVSSQYEGFGLAATGGLGKSDYRVKNLNDDGPGSLRDALSRGDRYIVFEVAGELHYTRELATKGPNVTIDFLQAPAPGITLFNEATGPDSNKLPAALALNNNVVVRGARVRRSGGDGINLYGLSTVVLDHCSVSGCGDGAIDITRGCKDVTMQWCILGPGGAENLLNLISWVSRISSHHNLYFGGFWRNPWISNEGVGAPPAEVMCDFRNNLVWDYFDIGTGITDYGTANVINNYYCTSKVVSALKTINPRNNGVAYVSGNVSKNGHDLRKNGNRATQFPCIEPATTDALTAAQAVVALAGARGPNFGLDAVDLEFIKKISLT